ncbi:uncharacterized protein MEPE_03348 [Melanopsichium pennsylvanicum]|uniref:Uncharacterized protein n=2 Tax=Melanopsichium pennsylvanicum TaxID=63383 RepID=A0AAJ4XKU9_9BASI|nr:putative protein [Melanopsichium pennsylvanicum 4]SNX84639.1 uncharacterized protein MEPE_03348 [Melanopsichium pennsylvanicum]
MAPQTCGSANAEPQKASLVAETSNRLDSFPKSSAAPPSINRRRRRRPSQLAKIAKAASGEESAAPVEDLSGAESSDESSINDGDVNSLPGSDSSMPEYEKGLSNSTDNDLTKSADGLALAEVDEEILMDAPAASTPIASAFAIKLKSGLPSADLSVHEPVNWSSEKETEEALKARKARRKEACKNKQKVAAAARKDELEKARLDGKVPPRDCTRCKTRHWEQDACPSKAELVPPVPDKLAPKPSSKRKLAEEHNPRTAGPSSKGKGRVMNVELAGGVSACVTAGRREPKHTQEFQDGTHCYLNLPKFSKEWQKGKQPEKAFSLKEIVSALAAAGLSPKQATDAGFTVEWLIKFESVSAAQDAVRVPLTLRGVRVRLTPFFGQGPRIFVCKTKGTVSWEELINSLHEFAPQAKFKLKREEFAGCAGNKCLLIFDTPQQATQISLVFKSAKFTVAFLPLSPLPPCAICCEGHTSVDCGSLVPVPCPPGALSFYDHLIADR